MDKSHIVHPMCDKSQHCLGLKLTHVAQSPKLEQSAQCEMGRSIFKLLVSRKVMSRS